MGYPLRRNSAANLLVLLQVQRSGDMGSPRVVGATNFLQLPEHCRLLVFDLLPASPGFAHPLVGNRVSLKFPQPSVNRSPTQTAG